MEEGQLKKRIDYELKKAAGLQYSPLRPRNQSEVAGMLEAGIKPNIHIVLDEAKKEFPIWASLAIGVHVLSTTTKETIADAASDLKKIDDWFLKWFGEVKKDV